MYPKNKPLEQHEEKKNIPSLVIIRRLNIKHSMYLFKFHTRLKFRTENETKFIVNIYIKNTGELSNVNNYFI